LTLAPLPVAAAQRVRSAHDGPAGQAD
jgi:hypothetical protein